METEKTKPPSDEEVELAAGLYRRAVVSHGPLAAKALAEELAREIYRYKKLERMHREDGIRRGKEYEQVLKIKEQQIQEAKVEGLRLAIAPTRN